MDFELSQPIRDPGNVLLADSWRKAHPELATLFDHPWLEGEPEKIELLIIDLEQTVAGASGCRRQLKLLNTSGH